MLIALDYDGTYTADPVLWDEFLIAARNRGHQVVCCTMRFEAEGDEVRAALAGKVERIVFAGRQPKAAAMAALGLAPAIWIDDQPAFIFCGG